MLPPAEPLAEDVWVGHQRLAGEQAGDRLQAAGVVGMTVAEHHGIHGGEVESECLGIVAQHRAALAQVE